MASAVNRIGFSTGVLSRVPSDRNARFQLHSLDKFRPHRPRAKEFETSERAPMTIREPCGHDVVVGCACFYWGIDWAERANTNARRPVRILLWPKLAGRRNGCRAKHASTVSTDRVKIALGGEGARAKEGREAIEQTPVCVNAIVLLRRILISAVSRCRWVFNSRGEHRLGRRKRRGLRGAAMREALRAS